MKYLDINESECEGENMKINNQKCESRNEIVINEIKRNMKTIKC